MRLYRTTGLGSGDDTDEPLEPSQAFPGFADRDHQQEVWLPVTLPRRLLQLLSGPEPSSDGGECAKDYDEQ